MSSMEIVAQSRKLIVQPRDLRDGEDMIPANALEQLGRPRPSAPKHNDHMQRYAPVSSERPPADKSKIERLCRKFLVKPIQYRDDEPMIDISQLPEAVGAKRPRTETNQRPVKKARKSVSGIKSAEEQFRDLFGNAEASTEPVLKSIAPNNSHGSPPKDAKRTMKRVRSASTPLKRPSSARDDARTPQDLSPEVYTPMNNFSPNAPKPLRSKVPRSKSKIDLKASAKRESSLERTSDSSFRAGNSSSPNSLKAARAKISTPLRSKKEAVKPERKRDYGKENLLDRGSDSSTAPDQVSPARQNPLRSKVPPLRSVKTELKDEPMVDVKGDAKRVLSRDVRRDSVKEVESEVKHDSKSERELKRDSKRDSKRESKREAKRESKRDLKRDSSKKESRRESRREDAKYDEPLKYENERESSRREEPRREEADREKYRRSESDRDRDRTRDRDRDSSKREKSRRDEYSRDESRRERSRRDDSRREESRRERSFRDEAKRERSGRDDLRRLDPMDVEPRRSDSRREDSRRDDSKRDERKRESSRDEKRRESSRDEKRRESSRDEKRRESSRDGGRRDERRERTRKEETRRDERRDEYRRKDERRDEARRDERRRSEPRKEEPRREDARREARREETRKDSKAKDKMDDVRPSKVADRAGAKPNLHSKAGHALPPSVASIGKSTTSIPLSKPAPPPLRSSSVSIPSSRPSLNAGAGSTLPRFTSKPMPVANGTASTHVKEGVAKKKIGEYFTDYTSYKKKAADYWMEKKYDDYEKYAIKVAHTCFEWGLAREGECRKQEKEIRASEQFRDKVMKELRDHYEFAKKRTRDHIQQLESINRNEPATKLKRIVNKAHLRMSMLTAQYVLPQARTLQTMTSALARVEAASVSQGASNSDAKLTNTEVRTMQKVLSEYNNVIDIYNRVVSSQTPGSTSVDVQEPGTECTLQ